MAKYIKSYQIVTKFTNIIILYLMEYHQKNPLTPPTPPLPKGAPAGPGPGRARARARVPARAQPLGGGGVGGVKGFFDDISLNIIC